MTVAMPGRSKPGNGRSRMVLAATMPPVLPGEIKPSALPSLTRFHGAENGAILFPAQSFDRLVLHGEDFAGVDDGDARVAAAGAGHGGA